MAANRLSESTRAERRAILAERGILVLSESYKGGRLWWHVRCRCGWEWDSTEKDLVLGKQGCNQCASDRPLTNEEAMAKVEILMPGKFRFLEPYPGSKKPWKLQCAECGHVWGPLASNILFVRKGRKPKGCPKCAVMGRGILSSDLVNDRLKARNLRLVLPYQGANVISDFQCLVCDNIWPCKPADVFGSRQCGCPNCADYGFKPNEPAVFYYARLTGPEGQPLWKVGITNRTAKARFYWDRRKVEAILIEERYPRGLDAKIREQAILGRCAAYRYAGAKFLQSGGESEIFTVDVLKLPNSGSTPPLS